MKIYTYYIQGMHCPSCQLTVESKLKIIPGVQNIGIDALKSKIEISGYFEENYPEEIFKRICNEKLNPFNYNLSIEKETKNNSWGQFKIALPIGLLIIFIFIVLQRLGLVDLIQADKVTYGTAFIIGLVASVSSCMAVVGGLMLSISAEFTRSGDAVKPQIFFHVGRIVSFFVLGGVIGAIGTAFTLNGTTTFMLGIIIGLVMLTLGLNLLDIFSWTNKLVPHLPQSWGKKATSLRKMNHSLTPLLVGVATFFLPCGFTQSMQLYTLTTGNFLSGGLTMLAFALGTLPVLALVSFSGAGIKNNRNKGVFFKTAGIVVIFFALLNIITSLTAAGIIVPLFTL
ncbi:MAG: sulfite exporter TauE/SafE family protein [Candidatus Paceibacterota bacterium]|jgi:sulfite exporter TauE/SafE/copper chaperone CopZ